MAEEAIDLKMVNKELITLTKNVEKAKAKDNGFLKEFGLPVLP